jgi:DNA-binding PadR family transcriptional regulator
MILDMDLGFVPVVKFTARQQHMLRCIRDRRIASFTGSQLCRAAQISASTFYPVIWVMETVNAVTSEWRANAFPRSKVYTMTEAGWAFIDKTLSS